MATEVHELPDRLIDRFGRHVNYVRISVTDRCDFRCVYWMGARMTFIPRAQVLTLEEMATLGRAFTELGVRKLRITGGEPLVRRNVISLFQKLGQLPGLEELTLTTNGSPPVLRAHPGDLPRLKRAIVRAIELKPKGHDFNRAQRSVAFRHMSATGG
ncbi:radical SAM protein [Thioalkalivibrio sp.]|uniref:radical SAM protein n=1 Tax=Thioalkalivibrio sp. TaxID=2093813 RepID=UPI0025DAEE11|nr:radical SAM protein [Thioalkalivibrio sp.]